MAGKGKRAWRWALLIALCILIGGGIGVWLALRTPRGRAALNIVEYRARVHWGQWFGEKADAGVGGAISGIVQDESGTPIVGATVLVSTVKGFTYQTESGDLGTFRIEDVPPGRYIVAAGKWGYDNAVYRKGSEERSQIVVRADQLTSGIDITMHEHQPWQPMLDEPPVIGPPQTGHALFPTEVYASRVPVTFTNEGLIITTTLIYEPLDVESAEPLPVIVTSYPSAPIDWDLTSVALANEGYVVLATGPSPQREIDIAGMGRDMLKAVAYLCDGQLTVADTERQGWLGGSYSGIILFQALREAPSYADALVLVGSISDGFLWVQALYDESLEIPYWHEQAVAALGRPDRVPEFYLQHSPAFHAEHLPPTLVIHTTADEVVPYNQSLRLDEALTAVGATHELFIYEDTSHYLDQVNITPNTAEVYRRLTVHLDTYVRQQQNPTDDG
jgi:hypothetical protein